MENNEKKKKINLGEFFKYLKFTYRYVKSQKKYLFLMFFVCIFSTGVSVLVPVLSAQELVKLTDNLWTELFIVIAAIFGLEMLRNTLRNINNFCCNKFYYEVRKNMQVDLVRETLRITTDNLNKNSSGVFIERINNDTDNTTDIFLLLTDYTTEIIGDIGVFISVFFISKVMFFVYLVFIIVLFFFHKRSSQINYEYQKVLKRKREKLGGFTSEIVRGAKDIKILNAENSFIRKTRSLIGEVNAHAYTTNRVRAKYRFINNSIWDVMDLVCSLVSVFMLMKGKLGLAAVLIIRNYQGRIMNISSLIETILEKIKSFELAASRIYGVLEGEEFEKEKFGRKTLKDIKGDIVFENVNFEYEEGNAILKQINFTVPAKKTVAFVGRSGSGKSTIFNLISALYKTNTGTIYLDGIPINHLDKSSIRGNLSIISQSPYIYNLSIRENLQIIKADATEEEMIRACKMACLHEFIISLKDGYDTIVGEGGVTLSGGQKQRLAIARAFLLQTKIILFDEATSALDNETQANIQKAISNMKGEFTVLIIAHRLSTVSNADKIFVVDNGKIIDEGTQKELLKTSRTFKKLYETELES